MELKIIFESRGHISYHGSYQERPDEDTKMWFDIRGDQSYLVETMQDIEKIANIYGGMSGVNKTKI